ncbi:MAG TPA: peptide deformylase [Lichenihabitans sp.]|jgi:peptide deformylase|nr:peptide deformylase [Lichenihabitans sp.]
MALRPIITLPDAKLRMTSDKIAKVDASVRTLLDDMIETMYDAPGIGLAAVQIGVLSRALVLDTAGKDEPPKPMFLVNPEILSASPERIVYEEGCLSIPDYYEDVERPEKIRVRFLDRDGAECELDAEGILAIAIQHEIDHLNGVLFIDHISRLKRDRVTRKFAKAARKAAEEGKPFDPREGERALRERKPPHRPDQAETTA